ncbi:tyrosyl-tRNA synthetase [Scheffersomyces spartinae]|uniref:Tyrosine--tRNA ligase n=1 Tax=Scheffersomyces spartinae TaxID=45513 RepID=A0A9P7VCQ4_9ASCO|nr:tyrosyl-tRNA synthetase [Scheffersomyces spartinae]KAG7195703.1 tyrosyl-tRNA synthetase [Scheffersomyces spartinae]
MTEGGKSYEGDMNGSLLAHLQARSLVESYTSDQLYELTDPSKSPSQHFKLYCGADPSAVSLHLGNLLPLMVLLHFRLRGHDVVGLVGGATGMVGDPSGRSTERQQLDSDERNTNVERISEQIRDFLEKGVAYAKSRNFPVAQKGTISSVNNAEWWKNVGFLEFLSKYGKHIRVNQMLARDSVQSRLQSQNGIGYNEFSYQILQAFDFWHLFEREDVNMQIGGNDQWGNITAGIDLIGRLQQHHHLLQKKNVYGMTVPLLTTPKGEKFGKSAGNAIFIDSQLTSPYQLYQYFVNVPDEMVGKLLKLFTLLPINVIDYELLPKHLEDPGLRIAQRVLAREVVDLIHGNGEEMAYITSFLFPTPDQPFTDNVSAETLLKNFRRSGIISQFSAKDFGDTSIDDLKLSTLLSHLLGKSKSETRRLIKAGGVYLGLERKQLEDPDDVVLFDKDNHLIDGKLLLVRTGKQNYHVGEFKE